MSEAPEETALYRVFGEANLLLYIGISNNFGRRWKEHAKKQPWWGERRRLTVDEWFPSRDEAKAAEKAAIKAEHPKYNHVHAVKRPPRVRESVVVRVTPRPLATAAEVAVYLKTSEKKLADWRRQDDGPECRLLGRTPRYRWDDVEEWLTEHPEADHEPLQRTVRPPRRARTREVPQGNGTSELRTVLLDALEDAMAAGSREDCPENAVYAAALQGVAA